MPSLCLPLAVTLREVECLGSCGTSPAMLLDENEKQGGLTGWVTLNNQSGATFQNASLKLVAGDVNRVQPVLEAAMADRGMAMLKAAPQFQEETFFEYHLYTLQRRADLKENQQKQVLFFDSDRVGVEKGYTFKAQPQYFYQGFVPPEGSEHVDVSLRFANSKQNGLGSPIPAGILRVYKQDRDGAPQFLGENQVRHTPKDETLEFAVGRAFDIVGDHAQMDYKRIDDHTAEMAYQVKLRNHKDETVMVRVLENFYGDWKILESSHEATKENSRTARFDVTVPPDKETIVTYRVRITS